MKQLGFVFLVVVAGACGSLVPFGTIGPRIINGVNATAGQFPWQVAIYVSFPTYTNLCGGAIISEKWILTAGHCASQATSLRIQAGAISLQEPDINRVTQTTQSYIVHPDYLALNLRNDIALIELSQSLVFNDNIQAVSLASEQLEIGTVGTVSGWGLTSDSSSTANNLLSYINVETISDEECRNIYGNLNDGVVCARGQGSPVHSTCEGDSGGPLVQNADSNPIQIGIVSFGHSDGCESGNPSGFTRVYFYRDWIREQIGI